MKNPFFSMIMDPPKGFWDQKMDLFSGYIWVFLSEVVQTLFWVFTKIFMRYCTHEAINSACSSNLCHEIENYQPDSNNYETITEAEVGCSKSSSDTKSVQQECGQSDSNSGEPEAKSKEDYSETVHCDENLGLVEKEETNKLVFKFQYQIWNCSEEFKRGYGGSFDFVNTNSDKASATASTKEYKFISGKSFSHFLKEEQEAASSCTVEELYVCSKDCPLKNDSIDDSKFASEGNLEPKNCERRCVDAAAQKLKTVLSKEQPEEDQVEILNNMFVKEIAASDNFHSKDDFICSSFDLDSISSIGDGFLSYKDFGTTTDLDTLGNHGEEIAGLTGEDLDFREDKNSDSFDDEDRGIREEEIRKLEEPWLQNSGIENLEKLKGHCFEGRDSINSKPEESVKFCSHNSAGFDLDDSYRFDAQWEHQDLIEQLKMELNKVRATGLLTILENSESLRIMKDLKPWEIDEKFQHGSNINELPKLYKSYRERMRKFDILNYQKLYAIGSLQSKDLLQSFSSRENSSPAITYFLPHGFRLGRRKKSESDPMRKFIGEFYSDLEMVYVGQVCLSWEFLKWEYVKALELWEFDQYRLHRYNEVAGEFQQFQVLLQRFIENEFFQGPRVENYVRNRCVMLNLLQVPVIREDNTKEEKKFKTGDTDKGAITIDILVEILEESIRIIWHFIRADKDASHLTHKSPRETQVDSELVMEIQAELQKKEKRFNEFLKSKSSIMKKFQKREEDGRDHFLYFFLQVDMKLIWRVLNMSRITRDQVAWCHDKLNKINFVNRRIHIEPSFLMFPC